MYVILIHANMCPNELKIENILIADLCMCAYGCMCVYFTCTLTEIIPRGILQFHEIIHIAVNCNVHAHIYVCMYVCMYDFHKIIHIAVN